MADITKWVGNTTSFTIGNIKRADNISSYAFDVKNSSGTVQISNYAYTATQWDWSGPSSVTGSATYTASAYINFKNPNSTTEFTKSNTVYKTVEYRQPITGISGLSGSIGLNIGTTANNVTGVNGSYTKAISVGGTNPYSTTWSGSADNTNVVTVTGSGSNGSNFVITPRGNGTTTAKASCTVATNGLNVNTNLSVTVATPSTAEVSLNVGGTHNSWGNAAGTTVSLSSGDTSKVTVSSSTVTAAAATAGTVITLTGSDGSKWSRKFVVTQQSGAGYATSSITNTLVTASSNPAGGTIDINPGDTIWVSSSFLSNPAIAEDGTGTTKLTKGNVANGRTPFTVKSDASGTARIKLSGSNASSLYINLNIVAINLSVT